MRAQTVERAVRGGGSGGDVQHVATRSPVPALALPQYMSEFVALEAAREASEAQVLEAALQAEAPTLRSVRQRALTARSLSSATGTSAVDAGGPPVLASARTGTSRRASTISAALPLASLSSRALAASSPAGMSPTRTHHDHDRDLDHDGGALHQRRRASMPSMLSVRSAASSAYGAHQTPPAAPASHGGASRRASLASLSGGAHGLAVLGSAPEPSSVRVLMTAASAGASLGRTASHRTLASSLDSLEAVPHSAGGSTTSPLTQRRASVRSLTLTAAYAPEGEETARGVTDEDAAARLGPSTMAFVATPEAAPNVRVAALLVLGDRCARLRTLDLADCVHVGDEQASRIFGLCALLEHVVLRGCVRLTSATLFRALVVLAHVRTLDLARCAVVGIDGAAAEADASALTPSAPPLVTLVLSGNTMLRDETLLRACVCLQRGSLRTLDLAGCVSLTDDTLRATLMCVQPFVERVDVSRCVSLSNATLRAFAGAPPVHPRTPLSHASSQLHVTLSGPSVGTSALLGTPLRQVTQHQHAGLPLRALLVDECTLLDDSGLHAVARGMPRLEELCASRTHMSDFVLRSLATHLPQLRRLVLRGCPLTGAMHSDAVFASLQELDLSQSSVRVARGRFPVVHTLTLARCPGATDEFVLSLPEHFPSLQRLDVRGCTLLTDSVPLTIALERIPRWRKLRELALDGCSRISEHAEQQARALMRSR